MRTLCLLLIVLVGCSTPDITPIDTATEVPDVPKRVAVPAPPEDAPPTPSQEPRPTIGRHISPYDRLIRKYSRRYGRDWLLMVAQMRAESAFRPDAVSPVGAVGLMQIMPSTAEYLGTSPKLLTDPETNIRLGIYYDTKVWNIFKAEEGEERQKFMLGAYNAGPGTVIKAQGKATVTNTWEGIAPHMPHETQVYVPRIFGWWHEYRQRAR